MKASRTDVAFLIVGTPRSGTTLVQRLACELPGVTVPPETSFFEWFARALVRRRRFPLDEAALRAELQVYLSRRFTRGLLIDLERIVGDLGGRCSDLVELFGAIVRDLAGTARVIGEKSPSHVLWWRHLWKAMPGVKFIAVVRDPRAVAASHQGVPWGTKSRVKLAENWVFEQREIARARDALGPDRVLVLRYEDVVRDPDAGRATIARFLRVPCDPPATLAHVPRSRLTLDWEWWKEAATGPITTDRVEAWDETLTDAEAAQIAAICRRQMRRFGYETGGRLGMGRMRATLRLPPRVQVLRLRYRAGIAFRARSRRRVARRGFPRPDGSAHA